MYYANALTARDHVKALIRDATPPPRAIVFDAEGQDDLDFTSAEVLKGLVAELRAGGMVVRFADVHGPVLERAREAGLLDAVGDGNVHPTVDLAVEADRRAPEPTHRGGPCRGPAMSWGVRFRIRQYIKNSLWLMPLFAGLGGLVLAELLNWVDERSDLAVLQYSSETATAVVSATIAATVSLTGFVVTVTVLGVQQATGIFSPRYMRVWYRDGRLKLVLAELVGTLMFSMAVIRRIHAGGGPGHQCEPDRRRPCGRSAAVPAVPRPVPASHAARGGRGAAGPRGTPSLRGLGGRGRSSRSCPPR